MTDTRVLFLPSILLSLNFYFEQTPDTLDTDRQTGLIKQTDIKEKEKIKSILDKVVEVIKLHEAHEDKQIIGQRRRKRGQVVFIIGQSAIL